MFLEDIYSNDLQLDTNYIEAIESSCSSKTWRDIWLTVDIFILITGLVANTALLWLFLRERRTLSASQVLGVNLVVMDLVYLCVMPFALTERVKKDQSFRSNHSVTSTASSDMKKARNIYSMLNLIGCPLLLACMCIERYLAVMRPVLYLRVRRWEYRVAVSAVVWLLTLSFCVASGFMNNMAKMMVPVSIIISCLFSVMLGCLGGVVWSLWQRSPAHATSANGARCASPLRRRAVGNVLAVVAPAVVTYLPVLVMVPVVVYQFYSSSSMDAVMCAVFELSQLFPRCGLLIGPLFYLSKAEQLCFLSRKDEGP